MDKTMKSSKKVWPVVKLLFSTAAGKYPWFFVLFVISAILETVLPFISILVTPLLVDEIVGDRNLQRMMLYAGIVIVGDTVLNIIHRAVQSKLQKYQERLGNYFAMQIGIHSMGLDFQLTEDKKALDQLEKARTGMTWHSGGVYGISEQVFQLISNVCKLAGFVTLIAVNAPWLLVFIAAYVLLNSWITAKCNGVELAAYQRLAKTNRLFNYFGWSIADFRYGKDIRLYDAKNMFMQRWEENTKESNDAWQWQGDMSFKYRSIGVLGKVALTFSMYAYVGMLVIRKVFSIGTFTQMVETANALDNTLNGTVRNVQELLKRCNYAYEYVLFMEYPEAIVKGSDPVPAGLHKIEFRNVSFAYPGTNHLILDNVSITIEPGQKLSIVGLNGAGKTTFIKLLCRLYDPTSGQILVDGKDIKEYDYKEYMKQYAPVFQDFKLFGFSIAENILAKRPEERNEEETAKIDALMKLVELDGMLGKLSKGIENTVFKIFDEDGIEPSGGEQQKMAIARALYKDAPVIILDEPTAALDPIAEYEIYRQFHTLVGNKTAFYISHRLSSCRFCDKIAVFSEGKIAEYGSHDELIRYPEGIYAAMFEAQAQYYR